MFANKKERIMKKVLCLLIALVTLVAFCGCFGGNEDPVTDPAKSPEFALGKVTDNTYKNDFTGLSFAAPEGWIFYSEEQILQLNNIAFDYLDEKAYEMIQNAAIVYDMYASAPIGGGNTNVNLEKIDASLIEKLDLKQTLESQFGLLEDAYKNMGFTDFSIQYEKIAVDGKEFDGMSLSAKISGRTYYSKCFIYKNGTYLVNVASGAYSESELADIINRFSVK